MADNEISILKVLILITVIHTQLWGRERQRESKKEMEEGRQILRIGDVH